MNAKRKEAALKAFLPVFNNAKESAEVETAIRASDKNYTDAEVAEILEALPAFAVEQETPGAGKAGDKLRVYEYWKVRLQPDNTWKKLEDLISTVKLEPRFADEINAHSHNSGFRYFEVA